MTTFGLPLDQVDTACLASLIADGVREGRQLEYKEQLPGGTDDDKREFLSDVTSLTNALGGDIIYGIRERRDSHGNPTGEPDAVVGLPGLNVDAERLRLENLMRDGVAPRMPLVTFYEIKRGPGPPCLLLRTPRSWGGLHMVIFKNLSRFYSRNSSGRYQLDVHEIRAGFLAGEIAAERVRRYRIERITRILAGETPIQLGEDPKLIFHGIPLDAGDRWLSIREALKTNAILDLKPIAGAIRTYHFNLDGFVVYTDRSDPSRNCYLQLFRDGGIEAVSVGPVDVYQPAGYDPGFGGHRLESAVIEAFESYQRAWRRLEVDSPLALGITVTGVHRLLIFPASQAFSLPLARFDRDVVLAPEVVVDDLDRPADVVLHPIFDLLWNAGGWAESPHYGVSGRWQSRW